MNKGFLSVLLMLLIFSTNGQHTVARKWNEVLLEAIRNDFARPTVHARNLLHISAGMYDAWAIHKENTDPYFLKEDNLITQCEIANFNPNEDLAVSMDKAISYVAFRLIKHRFLLSPGAFETYMLADSLMDALGYDRNITSTDFSTGSSEALGNYIAECIIQYGLQDGANEENDYENQFYEPVNPPLLPHEPGNPNIQDPNRWQPLTLETFIDQSGNEIPGDTPPFLSPEWGSVKPFSLSEDQFIINQRNEHDYKVYIDPGDPPYIESDPENYKWGFSLVSLWSAHLDPADGVMWDISPRSIGNLSTYPDSFDDYADFYSYQDGGDNSQGHTENPITGEPYEEQMVPRGDYARVLAEFWADGPDSETPPGHWFTILNYVSDHPLLEKKIAGEGPVVDDLEWDIKSYFLLGGTMHDVAISSWSLKGWYDYIRPVSAIRYLSDQGQSSDESLPNYDPNGIPLVDGFIELVDENDPLVGAQNEHLNKIKVYAWRGPDFISDPETDMAGVGWILAENWWPYQRPSFVTPPFAGFVSGHSTYSQAAAVVMSLFTGSEYFPGGIGEFEAKQNEFLVFEEGPSVDVILQWATYKDAADQCSLSRIWGGIHPPADDIPGRKIGLLIGSQAYENAFRYFDGLTTLSTENPKPALIYPNPAKDYITIQGLEGAGTIEIYLASGAKVFEKTTKNLKNHQIDISELKQGLYLLKINSQNESQSIRFIK
ncbi:Por secretion system C-terminal sorting domain-containing protein [Ekhidna lutea]|uniref:Por secretion system C-terminal sorting domain-containing protein n=1 Tax=Ekhidna lutea TaxID=447679 RepID=A0A239K2F7_EKHLU|nr:T9SS type A sorting domain-containing protein [Ekhidna lutea]SNT11862.1 Por secretion system C-terminal sorting domain-containing protein [Ekhidna lutea]